MFNSMLLKVRNNPVVISAITLATLFVLASLVQLKPLFWDTYQVSQSLQEFDSIRYILMTGMWLRALLLFPAIFLSVGLYQLFEGHSRYYAQVAVLLMFAYGVLSAVSGWVGVVVGVPAEEFQPQSANAHALQVLADSLFWIQDNLITMANITLVSSVLIFSLLMRSDDRWPIWATSAGILTLPFMLIAASSFYLQGGILFGSNLEGPVYIVGTSGVGIALIVWIAGIVTACGCRQSKSERTVIQKMN